MLAFLRGASAISLCLGGGLPGTAFSGWLKKEKLYENIHHAHTCLAWPVNAWSQLSNSPILDFTATALTGEKVSAAQLLGQSTILIVTPSTDAAKSTGLWAEALRKNIDPTRGHIRDVLATCSAYFSHLTQPLTVGRVTVGAAYRTEQDAPA
ncbi:hypothetical protein [Pseudomonas antarctica]|uniref:hypothetical protein n=1 Tax=Pseudomonas antarctica TaxID=219572 RepID=UPI00387B02DD